MSKIYFDHSATTPVDKRVLEEMLPFFEDKFGNPSSVHNFGQAALEGVDQARASLAQFLNCQPEEVIFTSGATEANNLVLKGVAKALQPEPDKKVGSGDCMDITKEDVKKTKDKKGSWKGWLGKDRKESSLHVITSSVEHKSVLEPLAEMEKQGVEITYLPVNSQGLVNPEDLKNAIKDNTVLVSLMYVNSEIGSKQPVREAGKIIKKINESRYSEWQKKGARKQEPKPQPVYFHIDATQAVNFFTCDIEYLHADFLSLSGHKIYGPKGVGALFIRQDSKIKGIQEGGGQEKKLRSGTLNTPGIVGLGRAIDLITPKKQKEHSGRISALRDRLVEGIKKNIEDVVLITDREQSSPAHAHMLFKGVEGESLLISLDLEGIAVSTGSACASRDLHSSYVLKAMGVGAEEANNAVRFTLGKHNTEDEIDKLLEKLPPIVARIRKMNPLYKK